MEYYQLFIVLCAGFFFTTPQYGDAVGCYVCNSGSIYEGNKCLEKNSLEHPDIRKDCNSLGDGKNYTRCRILVQDVEGEVRTIRSCATWPEGSTNRCIDRTGTARIKIRYCECEGDYCNSAPSFSIPVTLIVCFLVGVAYFKNY